MNERLRDAIVAEMLPLAANSVFWSGWPGTLAFAEAAMRVLYAPHAPAALSADKYDEVLLPFLALMRRELHANSGKGDRPGWLSMSPEVALLEVYYHLAKLQRAVRDENYELIAEHAADVANMAMMVLDITVDPWGLMATAGQPQPDPVVNSSACGTSATG